MRRFGKLGIEDAAAVAAHYGSVSVVTYLAAVEAVHRAAMPGEAYLPALVAVLEVPGIIVALLFASGASTSPAGWKKALHEVATGKSIVLLGGGLLIGALCGPAKLADVQPFFATAFKGALCIFMIELGLAAGRRLRDAGRAGARLLVLGCLIPVINGSLGVLGATLAGMSPGGAAVLGAMAGSASYIAAPAAVRVARGRAASAPPNGKGAACRSTPWSPPKPRRPSWRRSAASTSATGRSSSMPQRSRCCAATNTSAEAQTGGPSPKKDGRRGVPSPAAEVILPTSTPMDYGRQLCCYTLTRSAVSRRLRW